MFIHVVSLGENLWGIAQTYGASVERIIRDNGISNPQNLVVGQALIVLVPETVYVVQAEDTIDSIAGRFGISPFVLLQNNPEIILQPQLYKGQSLAISFEGENTFEELLINGYVYPEIERPLLKRTLPFLSRLTIFGYGFTLEGELIGINDQPLINLAYEYKTTPVMLLSSLTEEGNFNAERAGSLFRDPSLQDKVLTNIIQLMQQKGYLGLDIDFEFINPQDATAFLQFLRNAASRLHEAGFFVHTDLAPKTSDAQQGLLYEAHNYAEIGAISDTVLLMTYEWGYTYGPPMAVAPLNKVREVVQYAVSKIPAQKIFMGIPNYGYDWILPFEKGVTRATLIGNQYAVQIAARNHAVIQYDETAQSPFFEYTDEAGRRHVVWFEDVRSIQAKYQLIREFNLLGSSYWNIMRPFSQNWAFISANFSVQKLP